MVSAIRNIFVFVITSTLVVAQQTEMKSKLPSSCAELEDYVMGYVCGPALKEVILPPAWTGRGTFEAKLVIEKDGRVRKILEVTKSTGDKDMDQLIVSTILNRWNFYPAERDGKTVAVYIIVRLVYSDRGVNLEFRDNSDKSLMRSSCLNTRTKYERDKAELRRAIAAACQKNPK